MTEVVRALTRRQRSAGTRTARVSSRAGFTVESITQHWRRLPDGRWARDAWVVLPDGSRRLYAFPEETAA